MKFNYYEETDSLYIDLKDEPSSDSREVATGVVVDFNEQGNIVGIDIDNASKIVNLSDLEAHSLPVQNISVG